MASPSASAMRAMISNAITAAQAVAGTRRQQARSQARRPPWLAAPRVAVGRPASPSITAFTGRQTGLPLTGGQNQAFASSGGEATVQVGPQGAGTVWYPAQATISTTTGMTTGIDTAICNVYLGAAGTPITLLATVFSGNGLVAAALPNLTVGEFIIAEWSGATPGDACALNVQGLMSALVMQ